MSDTPSRAERRRQSRIRLAVPVRVQGHNSDGTPWEEMTTVEDADYGGASFRLRHAVQVGHAFLLSLPLPKSFRRYDLTAPSYTVYALVRNTNPLPDGLQRVGVMYLGRNPPKDHEANPGGRFLLPGDADLAAGSRRERREGIRYDVSVEVRLVRTPPVTHGPPSERTITRNLGLGGAMVLTSLPLSRGDEVVFEDLDGALRTRATVEGLWIGDDNIPRLNLAFLDPDAAEGARMLLRRSGIF